MISFEKIINSPSLVKVLDTGTKVIRVRMHEKPHQEFNYRKDLHYPPVNKTRLMRANLQGTPIFYGSIFSESDDGNDSPRLTCLCEACEEIRDDFFVGKKDFSYSLWVSKRPINLFIIPIFNSYKNPPVDFKWYFQMWKKLIDEYKISKDMVQELQILSDKFSHVPTSSEEDEIYTYTASFTKQLLETHSEIDGIMYPSARLGNDGLGINIAIRPEVIDSSFDLKHCLICHLVKRDRNRQIILNYKHSRINPRKIRYSIDKEYYNDFDKLNSPELNYNIRELDFRY